MVSKRQRRVADQIREIVAEIIQFEVEDPRLNGVTVMDVTIDRELEVAHLYVSCIRGESSREEVITSFASAGGFLRRELGKRIHLRKTPELRFQWDEMLGEADRIDAVIKSIEIPPANEVVENSNDRPA